MFRFSVIIFALSTSWYCAEAMECAFSNGNDYTSQFGLSSAKLCPRIFDSPDKVFCCLNDDAEYYCCDANEFERNPGAGVLIAIVVGAIVLFCSILCICCCCCPCCCLYKRRHRGTVYGNMPQPGVQTTVVHTPQPVAVPMHAPMHAPMYPPGMQQPGAMPQAHPPQPGFYPPSYDQATAKQAPYNPNY